MISWLPTNESKRLRLHLSSKPTGASVFSSECNVCEGGRGSFVEGIVSLVEKHTLTDTSYWVLFFGLFFLIQ